MIQNQIGLTIFLLMVCPLFITSIGIQAETTTKNYANLPYGFVYLKDYNPNIKVNLRYASRDNFTGRNVPFYNGHSAICTR